MSVVGGRPSTGCSRSAPPRQNSTFAPPNHQPTGPAFLCPKPYPCAIVCSRPVRYIVVGCVALVETSPRPASAGAQGTQKGSAAGTCPLGKPPQYPISCDPCAGEASPMVDQLPARTGEAQKMPAQLRTMRWGNIPNGRSAARRHGGSKENARAPGEQRFADGGTSL